MIIALVCYKWLILYESLWNCYVSFNIIINQYGSIIPSQWKQNIWVLFQSFQRWYSDVPLLHQTPLVGWGWRGVLRWGARWRSRWSCPAISPSSLLQPAAPAPPPLQPRPPAPTRTISASSGLNWWAMRKSQWLWPRMGSSRSGRSLKAGYRFPATLRTRVTRLWP